MPKKPNNSQESPKKSKSTQKKYKGEKEAISKKVEGELLTEESKDFVSSLVEQNIS